MNAWSWLALYLGVSLVVFITMLEGLRWVAKREEDQETLAVVACVDSQLGWAFFKFTLTWWFTFPAQMVLYVFDRVRAKTRSRDSE